MTEREFALSVVRRLQEAGYQALWAGGCVRDELLNRIPKDYDVATDARPEEVRRLFRKTVTVGMSFGVVEVLGPHQDGALLKVQVATFRSDCQYSDGRHPDAVVFSSPREDALRRDFTINGMFFDPIRGELLDFVGGQEDLRSKVLRAIGDPLQRLEEDKLRLLRAVRIATRFDLQIEARTANAIRAMAPLVTVVSAERIAEELRQMLVHPSRIRAVELMDQLGLIQPILPELLALKDSPANYSSAPANGDLWDHTLRVLDHLGPQPTVPLALAALLHAIGRRGQQQPERGTGTAAAPAARGGDGRGDLPAATALQRRERPDCLAHRQSAVPPRCAGPARQCAEAATRSRGHPGLVGTSSGSGTGHRGETG